ncbi:unnamed protein product, partial [Ectocarpus sp. 13 AM-2016]
VVVAVAAAVAAAAARKTHGADIATDRSYLTISIRTTEYYFTNYPRGKVGQHVHQKPHVRPSSCVAPTAASNIRHRWVCRLAREQQGTEPTHDQVRIKTYESTTEHTGRHQGRKLP